MKIQLSILFSLSMLLLMPSIANAEDNVLQESESPQTTSLDCKRCW